MAPGRAESLIDEMVALDTTRDFFAFLRHSHEYVVEPGEFEIVVGDSLRDFDLQKATPPVTK